MTIGEQFATAGFCVDGELEVFVYDWLADMRNGDFDLVDTVAALPTDVGVGMEASQALSDLARFNRFIGDRVAETESQTLMTHYAIECWFARVLEMLGK